MRLDDVLGDDNRNDGHQNNDELVDDERPDTAVAEGGLESHEVLAPMTADHKADADTTGVALPDTSDYQDTSTGAAPPLPESPVLDNVSFSPHSQLTHPSSPRTLSQPASGARGTWAGVWDDLPAVNRVLALAGGLCLLLAAIRLTVPPVVEATASAVHPYTSAGRSENCLANLGALHQALGMYAQDHEGFYPPLDYTRPTGTRPAGKGKEGERVTWVSLLYEKTTSAQLQCPAGPGIDGQGIVSSYALNPVLSIARAADVDSAGDTLLLADGSVRHDLSLLPPFPSWPSFTMRATSPSGGDSKGTATNLALRHGEHANVVYADGHAALIAGGDWEKEVAAWGGSAVLRRALTRLAGQSRRAGELVAVLKAGDIKASAALLRAHRKEVAPVRDGLASLWSFSEGANTSDSVTQAGWNLARAATAAGDDSIEKRLNTEQSRRSQAELERTKKGGWTTKTTSWGASVQMPSGWTLEEEIEGRYKRAFLRSSLKKDVFVLIETGEHRTYVTPRPIDWGGMERDLRQKYGKAGYRRIVMGSGVLNGQAAGLWEYEVEKAGGPRLHKRYIGYSDGSYSHVVGYTAPARDFMAWQALVERIK